MSASKKPLIVAIGSQNKAKVGAVKKVFGRVFPDYEIVFVPLATESRVKDQPIQNNETMIGAINRARHARDLSPEADYFVGLEGGVDIGAGGHSFVFGWVAIINVDQRMHLGSSSWVELPNGFHKPLLMDRANLGDLIREIATVDDQEVRQVIGTNGVLTAGFYTREQEFCDAVTCALAPFLTDYYD
jgi:inosine/xanthosine triphosphatase